ncbi:hypothetical protein PWT90_10365 [Aphanocladium album]|nr:hypothetical protein PWT90_10365 [Aphanocladium album]
MRKLSRSGTSASNTSSSHSGGVPSAASVPASLADPSLPLPRLIVFDLDYTLWPFWVDTHVTPPLKANAAHTAAADRYGEDYAFYHEVPYILQLLPRAGMSLNPEAGGGGGGGGGTATTTTVPIKLGVASRTSAPSLARDLLKMLHLPAVADAGQKARRAGDVFDAGMEIYPGSKIKHFEALQKRTGIRYEDMLFFDDESRNMETEKLGVTMRLVRDGVTWAEVEKGVEEWRKRRGYKKN